MKLDIEIDPGSGFCNGVVRAIDKAEQYLSDHRTLYSLGSIVHNSVELERLKKKGLIVLNDISNLKDSTVLIRAHGEPPATYNKAIENNLELIDCTCPVVLKLQERVRKAWEEISTEGGSIVIFGKRGHAEVNGLVGQTQGQAVVVESVEEISSLKLEGKVALFSQTTKDPVEYRAIADAVLAVVPDAKVYDTICRQVAHRHSALSDFAARHNVVLFVSGRESSNGKILFELCRSVNQNTHWLEGISDIDISWFKDGDKVGICGATSTPLWQLEDIFVYLQSIC